MQLPSSLLENAVNEFAKLPGIGKKSALRMVLHLLNQLLSLSNTLNEGMPLYFMYGGIVSVFCACTQKKKDTKKHKLKNFFIG